MERGSSCDIKVRSPLKAKRALRIASKKGAEHVCLRQQALREIFNETNTNELTSLKAL